MSWVLVLSLILVFLVGGALGALVMASLAAQAYDKGFQAGSEEHCDGSGGQRHAA